MQRAPLGEGGMMTRSLLGLRVGIFILTFLFAFWGLPALFVGQPGPASISDKLLLQIKNGSGQEGVSKLELSRPARAWEFLGAVGTRAGIFGSESGPFEVWVYPLKILHDLKLRFHVPRSEEHTSELQSRGHLVCR